MHDRRRGWRATVAVAIAGFLLLASPRSARAETSHEAASAPFMFVAAAFATAMIIVAVSQAGDGDGSATADTTATDDTADDGTSTQAMRYAPTRARVGHAGRPRIVGHAGRPRTPGHAAVGGGTRKQLTLCLGFSGRF